MGIRWVKSSPTITPEDGTVCLEDAKIKTSLESSSKFVPGRLCFPDVSVSAASM